MPSSGCWMRHRASTPKLLSPGAERHLGLVVDDHMAARDRLRQRLRGPAGAGRPGVLSSSASWRVLKSARESRMTSTDLAWNRRRTEATVLASSRVIAIDLARGCARVSASMISTSSSLVPVSSRMVATAIARRLRAADPSRPLRADKLIARRSSPRRTVSATSVFVAVTNLDDNAGTSLNPRACSSTGRLNSRGETKD